MNPARVDSVSRDEGRQIKLKLFLWSLAISAILFLAFDWLYSAAILRSAVAVNTQGFCFARDPVRHFAFQPNCACTRPWLRDSYPFYTNSLGFRDERIRDVRFADFRPRILILGDSAPEGMTSWSDSFIGRVAAKFPQYEFLNGSVEGYSPSNFSIPRAWSSTKELTLTKSSSSSMFLTFRTRPLFFTTKTHRAP